MPIGSFTVIPHIAFHLASQQPARVLDVGIGFGMYGAVVREWVDLGVQPWKCHLEGVEVHEAYRNPVWDLYNKVFIGTASQYLEHHAEPFNAVILGDVIEHLEKSAGRKLLVRLQQMVALGGDLFVTTPAEFVEQGAVCNNPYERHVSHWIAEEFTSLGFRMLLTGRESQIAFHPTLLAHWKRPA